MDIIKAYATKNLCYIASQKMIPKGIVVHSTGANNPYLKRYVDCSQKVGKNIYGNHWNQAKPEGRKVCVHAFIGYDKNNDVKVAEILPLDICCWGVGNGRNGSYNYNPAYIQFEICEDSLTNYEYYQKAFFVAAEYCAKLCQKYNISIENIVGHCEAFRKGYGSNHGDPEHWMKKYGQTMSDFRKLVFEVLNNYETDEDKASSVTSKKETLPKINDGDLVAIACNATYYNGKSMPSWVKSQRWYVRGVPKLDRVVIDKNEKGTNSICSAVNAKYLKVVSKSDTPTNITKDKVKNSYPYLVKIAVNSLNIRKDSSVDSKIVGCINDRGVYTIVDERNGTGASLWGKLKSGAGWISLDFVEIL